MVSRWFFMEISLFPAHPNGLEGKTPGLRENFWVGLCAKTNHGRVAIVDHPLRNSWFTRVIFLFLATTLVSVAALATLGSAFLWNLRVQTQWEETQSLGQRAWSVITQIRDVDAELSFSLYRDSNLSRQLDILVTRGQEAYLGYRLNSLSSDTAGPGISANQFFYGFIDSHPGLSYILIYSPSLGQYHRFLPGRKSEFFESLPTDPRAGGDLPLPPNLGQSQAPQLVDDGGRAVVRSVHAFRLSPDDRVSCVISTEHDLAKTLGASRLLQDPGDRFIVSTGSRPILDTGGERKGDPLLVADLRQPGLRTIDLGGPMLVQHHRLESPAADLYTLHPLGHPPSDLGLILGTALALTLVGVLVAWSSVRYYYSRIRDLLVGIEALRSGNLGTRIPLGARSDELSLIASSFNTMVADLEDHVNRVYVAEIEQAKAETLAYQSQVNPHFLSNTLEAIRMRAVVYGAEDVAEMIFILSSLFRRMVKQGVFITLEDEVRHCRLYLDLFRIRYPQSLAYEVILEPGLEEERVLKFILQPVVENYIIHGFAQSRDDNRVTVRISRGPERIRFVVEDNGVGVPEERLSQVQAILATKSSSPESMGLSNLQARLRVNYGNDCLVKIERPRDGGCRVWFEIPIGRD